MTRAAIGLLVGVASSACTPGEEAKPPRATVTEELDGLWLQTADGVRRRVTATSVNGYDYDSLAAKQEEGRVIFYWAAAPVLSPRGDVIAYATNREAVASDTSGQSIWMVDLASGRERPLLHEAGRSFRPVGWWGADVVVYIGDRPGVWGVDVMSRRTRLLAPGTFVAAADDGSAVAIAEGVPDDVSIRVLTDAGFLNVPAPPGELEFLAQGIFSADGAALILHAAADSGFERVRFRFDLAERSLVELDRSTVAPRR